MRRRVATAVATAVLGAVLGGCGSDSGGSSAAKIEVQLKDYAFEPATVTIPKKGATLTLKNVGAQPHDLTVPSKGIGSRDVQPGASAVLVLDDLAPGSYKIVCSIPGHIQLGMVGTLTVSSS